MAEPRFVTSSDSKNHEFTTYDTVLSWRVDAWTFRFIRSINHWHLSTQNSLTQPFLDSQNLVVHVHTIPVYPTLASNVLHYWKNYWNTQPIGHTAKAFPSLHCISFIKYLNLGNTMCWALGKMCSDEAKKHFEVFISSWGERPLRVRHKEKRTNCDNVTL